MGLVLLALRSYLVFQNIFITFKTLKTPPPSSRNNGRPSVRAITQRKRDMKGCMAIWIVWACLATYEVNVERFLSIFIPFYGEIKSVILVFLILSRARSAEPIYLHVIRPLIKPYVSTLDSILDFIHNIGDFILLVLSLPVHAVLSWWRGTPPPDDVQTEGDTDSLRSLATSPAWTDVSIPPDEARYSRRPTDIRQDQFYAAAQPAALDGHQIWHPPASAYDSDEEPASTRAAPGSSYAPPMAMPEPQIPAFNSEAGTVDEWRLYPPFPSAYPPTPVHHSSGIPMPVPLHPSQFAVIPEQSEQPGLDASGHPHAHPTQGSEQSFGQSLLSPRELPNPGSDGDLSDDIHMSGVQEYETRYIVSDDDDDDDEDEEYETEEDDFDVTLKTPYKLRTRTRAVPMDRARSNFSIVTAATVASSSDSSRPSIRSDSARLSTVERASSLRTTTSPALSAATSITSSAAGRKRPFPQSQPNQHARVQGTRSPRRKATITNDTRSRLPRSRSTSLRANAEGTTSEETLDDDRAGRQTTSPPSEDDSSARKRRRVAGTPRAKGSARPRPAPRSPRPTNGKRDPRDAKVTSNPRANLRPVTTRTSLRTINARMAAAPASRLPSVTAKGVPTSKRPPGSFVEQGQGARQARGRDARKVIGATVGTGAGR